MRWSRMLFVFPLAAALLLCVAGLSVGDEKNKAGGANDANRAGQGSTYMGKISKVDADKRQIMLADPRMATGTGTDRGTGAGSGTGGDQNKGTGGAGNDQNRGTGASAGAAGAAMTADRVEVFSRGTGTGTGGTDRPTDR